MEYAAWRLFVNFRAIGNVFLFLVWPTLRSKKSIVVDAIAYRQTLGFETFVIVDTEVYCETSKSIHRQ